MANIYKTKKQEKSLDSRLDHDISLKNGNKLKKLARASGAVGGGAGTYVWSKEAMEASNSLVFSGTSDKVYYGGRDQVDMFPWPEHSRTEYGTFETTELTGMDKIVAYLGRWMDNSPELYGDVTIGQAIGVALGATIAGGLAFLASGGASYLKNVAMNTIAKGIAKYQLRKTPETALQAQEQSEAYERILDLIPETPELPSGLEQELDA